MSGIRARSRPRKRSANFRRVRWWVLREAALNVLEPYGRTPVRELNLRAQLTRLPLHRIVRRVDVALFLHPERRIYPPGAV